MADPINLCDNIPIAGLRRDEAGNLVGYARAARTGVQLYAGYELGRPDLRVVRVYRPEEEVFHVDSMKTFAGIPLTVQHSVGIVTPDNWRDHAIGETASDDIVRDGEVVKVPFLVRDAAGIEAIEAGKTQCSMGYKSVIDWTAGQSPKGEPYDAVQRQLRMNNLSFVDAARGGPELRIGDSELPKPKEDTKMTTKTVIVDGLSVETTDAGAQAIEKLLGERKVLQDKVASLNETITAKDADIAKKDGEIAAKDATLAEATSPAKLAAAAAARSQLCEDARRVVPKIVTDGKSDADIMREVVDTKMGEVGKALADESVCGAFAALVDAAPKDKGSPSSGTRDPVASFVADGGDAADLTDAEKNLSDAKAARLAYLKTGREPAKA